MFIISTLLPILCIFCAHYISFDYLNNSCDMSYIKYDFTENDNLKVRFIKCHFKITIGSRFLIYLIVDYLAVNKITVKLHLIHKVLK